MKIGIRVLPRKGLADPQSETVLETLRRLGFSNVDSIEIGRWMTVSIRASSEKEALESARSMCSALLTNPIMEDAEIRILENS